MNLVKKTLFIFFFVILGVYLGTYVYNKYKKDNTKEVFSESNNAYLLQYGVYKEKDSMLEAGNKLSNYFYYKDKDGYHIIIGITYDKNNSDKIKNSYNIEDNIYLKEINLNNNEFIENLKQYDLLINSTDSSNTIINAEKQILNKYEELVLNNE